MTIARAGRLVLPGLCLFFAVLFGALGVWQIERLRWKLDLIERVESRIAQPPLPVSADIDSTTLEYRPVRATGTFMHERETLVQALTERGAGYWVMTPLSVGDGTILVNRGFVPEGRTRVFYRPKGQVTVEGLLRLNEPNGRFLRANRPNEDRWYSRDLAAIAGKRGLERVAPYFIDAGPAADPGALPVGGLTVLRFRNAHLIYALTWFGLAGLSIFGLRLVLKGGSRR